MIGVLTIEEKKEFFELMRDLIEGEIEIRDAIRTLSLTLDSVCRILKQK